MKSLKIVFLVLSFAALRIGQACEVQPDWSAGPVGAWQSEFANELKVFAKPDQAVIGGAFSISSEMLAKLPAGTSLDLTGDLLERWKKESGFKFSAPADEAMRTFSKALKDYADRLGVCRTKLKGKTADWVAGFVRKIGKDEIKRYRSGIGPLFYRIHQDRFERCVGNRSSTLFEADVTWRNLAVGYYRGLAEFLKKQPPDWQKAHARGIRFLDGYVFALKTVSPGCFLKYDRGPNSYLLMYEANAVPAKIRAEAEKAIDRAGGKIDSIEATHALSRALGEPQD